MVVFEELFVAYVGIITIFHTVSYPWSIHHTFLKVIVSSCLWLPEISSQNIPIIMINIGTASRFNSCFLSLLSLLVPTTYNLKSCMTQ